VAEIGASTTLNHVKFGRVVTQVRVAPSAKNLVMVGAMIAL
jgi:hypothetical protein